MTSPTQTVVGKDKIKPVDSWGFAKNPKGINSYSKIQLIDSHQWNDEATKRRQVNTTPLTTTFQHPQPDQKNSLALTKRSDKFMELLSC